MTAAIRITSAAGVLTLLAVTLAHPSATRMHTWPWAGVAALLWLLPVAAALATLAVAREWRTPCRLLGTGLMLLAATAVAAAWTSPFAETSLARTWPTLGGVALAFLLHHRLTDPRSTAREHQDRIAATIALGGAVVIIVALVGWLNSAAPSVWWVRNAIPFGHSTYTAGFVVLVLPWLIQRSVLSPGLPRAGWIAITAAALVVLAGTSSRGGVVALAAVAAAAVGATLLVARWSRRTKALVAAGAIAVALTAVLTNPRLRELVLHVSWGEGAQESNRQRSAMFDAGIRLGRERPVLGWGPGTVPLAYPQVRARLDGGVENVLQLHNAPVQIWATLGIAGTAALVLIVGGTVRAAAGSMRARRHLPNVLPAAASLGGYGIFALTDHQFDLPAIAALTAANLACLTAAASGRVMRPPPAAGRGALAVAVAALLVARPVAALAGDLHARHAYEQAILAWESGRGSAFVAALDRAAAIAPHNPYFRHQAAAALLEAHDRLQEPAGRRDLAHAAAGRLEASLGTGIHEEFAHFNLGWLLLDLERPAAAAQQFAAAARRVPDKGGVYFGLGLALLDLNRPAGAVRAFALEWINDPRSMTSPAWEVPALAAVREAVRDETLRLYAILGPQHAAAGPAAAWTRWWLGLDYDAAELARGFSNESRGFAAALPALAARQPIATGGAWVPLYAAWREADDATHPAFEHAVPHDAALAAALRRRAARYPDDFRAFLSAPTGDEPALMRTYRRQRPGYGVLATHPDGPLFTDRYVVQEHRVASDFAAGLFPAKGWLPGRFLLKLLPTLPPGEADAK
jgi:O-antigen ligase